MAVIDLTIDNTKVPATLTDFPVYVDLSDMPAAFWSEVTSSGGDIRVYQSDGTTECAREVVSCDTATETGELHFLANSISSSVDTVFKIEVDGTSSEPATSATYGRNAVWSDYEIVVHMTDSTTSAVIESTGNMGTASKVAANRPEEGSGDKTTNKQTFSTSTDDYINISTANIFDSDFSITAYFKPAVFNTTQQHIAGFFEHRDIHISTPFNNSSPHYRFFMNVPGGTNLNIITGNLTTGVNYLGHFVRNKTAGYGRILLDGSQVANQSFSSDALAFANASAIGSRLPNPGREYRGDMEEFRLAKFAYTNDWSTTEYNNQNSPSTFYTITEAGGGGGVIAPQFRGFARL